MNQNTSPRDDRPGPHALTQGELDFNFPVPCYVVDPADGSAPLRTLTFADAVFALTGHRPSQWPGLKKAGESTKPKKRKPTSAANDVVRQFAACPIIEFTTPSDGLVQGIEALAFYKVCQEITNRVFMGTSPPELWPIVQQARLVETACGGLGILGLIDDASGYQDKSAHRGLQRVFAILMRSEPAPWVRTFPEDLYKEFARLSRVAYRPGSRPLLWGKITMAIYRCCQPGLEAELRRHNPNPTHRRNHHQWLTPAGRKLLNETLRTVLTLARTSSTMPEFMARIRHEFLGEMLQLNLLPAA